MITAITPNSNFQLSAVGVGVIAVGLADIRQCIDFILRTIPGSDPLRPLFGCDIYKYIDAPINFGVPNMKKVIFEALELWEPRIIVTAITHEIKVSTVYFKINYQVKGTDLTDELLWGGNSETITTEGLVLTANVPPKILNSRYNISFSINGEAVYPSSPIYGFQTAKDILDWVTLNYSSFGKWYLTANKLVLYFGGIVVYSAKLLITQTAFLTKTVQIPYLEALQFFNLSLTVNGSATIPIFPIGTINNLEQLLTWVNTNWGNYGAWYVINNTGDVLDGGDFGSDFSEDFSTGTTPGRQLVFQTNLYTPATLAFI